MQLKITLYTILESIWKTSHFLKTTFKDLFFTDIKEKNKAFFFFLLLKGNYSMKGL